MTAATEVRVEGRRLDLGAKWKVDRQLGRWPADCRLKVGQPRVFPRARQRELPRRPSLARCSLLSVSLRVLQVESLSYTSAARTHSPVPAIPAMSRVQFHAVPPQKPVQRVSPPEPAHPLSKSSSAELGSTLSPPFPAVLPRMDPQLGSLGRRGGRRRALRT